MNTNELQTITEELLSFFVPLALNLTTLRVNKDFLEYKVKAKNQNEREDVVTKADIFVQKKIKAYVTSRHPDWQFWGEEGEDNISTYDKSKKYLLIADPLEGTNNFRFNKDDQWGSVLALVDIESEEPIISIVAHPTKRNFYVGIKDGEANIYQYDEKGVLLNRIPMSLEPEKNTYTYNNSPHFSQKLQNRVQKFISKIEPETFEDPESGALEAVRHKGTIYFKTSNEIAAVFVILTELGGKVTDAQGNPGFLGINTLIAARTTEDYTFLKSLYEQTI